MSDEKSEKKGLFGWFGKKKKTEQADSAVEAPEVTTPEEKNTTTKTEQAVESLVDNQTDDNSVEQSTIEQEAPAEEIKPTEKSKPSLFQRLKSGLSKTRSQFSKNLSNLILGQKEIDDDLLEEIETLLLMADVGVDTTNSIIQDLTEKSERKELMLAAGDTFRAAAVEQLKAWGERNDVPVVAQHTGADSASVIFDAVEAAKARQVDVVIADTAGRLHTKSNLMEELTKVKRVIGKVDQHAPHEVMLVVDAVFALADKMKLPIRYIGVGESKEDLRVFSAKDYIDALFD